MSHPMDSAVFSCPNDPNTVGSFLESITARPHRRINKATKVVVIFSPHEIFQHCVRTWKWFTRWLCPLFCFLNETARRSFSNGQRVIGIPKYSRISESRLIRSWCNMNFQGLLTKIQFIAQSSLLIRPPVLDLRKLTGRLSNISQVPSADLEAPGLPSSAQPFKKRQHTWKSMWFTLGYNQGTLSWAIFTHSDSPAQNPLASSYRPSDRPGTFMDHDTLTSCLTQNAHLPSWSNSNTHHGR